MPFFGGEGVLNHGQIAARKPVLKCSRTSMYAPLWGRARNDSTVIYPALRMLIPPKATLRVRLKGKI